MSRAGAGMQLPHPDDGDFLAPRYLPVPSMPSRPLGHQGNLEPRSDSGPPSDSGPGSYSGAPSPQLALGPPAPPDPPVFSGPSGLQAPLFPQYNLFASGPPVTQAPPEVAGPAGPPPFPGPPVGPGRLEPRKPRQERTVYRPEQLSQLEDAFAKSKYPSAEQKAELAQKLKVAEEKVQVWFKNRRARVRREELGGQPRPGTRGPGKSSAPGRAAPYPSRSPGPTAAPAPSPAPPGPQVPAAEPTFSRHAQGWGPQDPFFPDLVPDPLLSPSSLQLLQGSDSFEDQVGFDQTPNHQEADASMFVGPAGPGHAPEPAAGRPGATAWEQVGARGQDPASGPRSGNTQPPACS